MRILFFLLLAAGFTTARAQGVNGVVSDNEGKALSGVTISLLKDTGSAVLKLAVSKDNGSYTFSDIQPGSYRVSASHIAHKPQVSAVFSYTGDSYTLPSFRLEKNASDMSGVVVTARKPIIEVKAEKTILNVEGTINAVGSDALELLRKSPGVSVDKDDNLSLSGKNGVQVFIDGRPSPLSGQDLANYLKSLQSTNIEAIELITNPSAKYEAAGNAGIINIRLKKNKSLGVNGSVTAGWNIGVYAKYNTGASLNYRNRKWNLFGNYNLNRGNGWNRMSIYRTTADSLFDQHTEVKAESRSHNFKAGADFFLNPKSTLGVMVNGNLSEPSFSSLSRTNISPKSTGIVDRFLLADNNREGKSNNLNFNANYSYTGKDGKSLTLNGDHGTYTIRGNQLQPNEYFNYANGQFLSNEIYRMLTPSDIEINSFKADYEQNFMKGKLGFGGKFSYVTTDNNFRQFDVINGSEQLDRDRSNLFEYKENINAGYVNYNRALKGFMFQAGLRVENTILEGVSNGQRKDGADYTPYQTSFKRNYTNFFPSAALTYNKNPMSQFSLSYSRRIDRPAYQDLNPFEMKLDAYSIMKGNINLQPQYTNSFGLTHTFKYKLNTTLNYSRVSNLFTQLIDNEGSRAILSKRNLASQNVVSLNVSYPFMYKSYTLFGNLNSSYSRYKANFGEGRSIDIDAYSLNLYVQNSLKFAKTWTAELSGYYNAPTVYMGNFRGKALGGVDAGLQKQVMKGKATVKASVSDIFQTLRFRGTSEFAGQTSVINTRWESRQFKLNLVYRFGSNQVKAARQRSTGAEEESKRVQQGGGGIGIGQ